MKESDFKGTPGEWIIRIMPSDGQPFIQAPKVLPTAGYDIEVFGDRDANYPEEMRHADIMLGAASKDLLFAVMKTSEMLKKLGLAKKYINIENCIKDLDMCIEKALTPVPEFKKETNWMDNWNPILD